MPAVGFTGRSSACCPACVCAAPPLLAARASRPRVLLAHKHPLYTFCYSSYPRAPAPAPTGAQKGLKQRACCAAPLSAVSGGNGNQPGPIAASPSAPARRALTLPKADAASALTLDLIPEGRGQAVVVVAVAPGSAAEAAGVTPGCKILAVSDPNRGELWELKDRPSLRFVRDALRMRQGPTVDIVLQASCSLFV